MIMLNIVEHLASSHYVNELISNLDKNQRGRTGIISLVKSVGYWVPEELKSSWT
jgi:hypothetical protein